MKSSGDWAWRSRTKCWWTSSLAGARGRLFSPRSISGRRPSVRHNVSRQGHPSGGNAEASAEAAGRRGCPPRAGAGSAAEAPVTRSGKGEKGRRSKPRNDRSRGGPSGPHTGAAEGPERGEERPASERDREPPAPSPSGAASGVTAACPDHREGIGGHDALLPPRLRGAPLHRLQISETSFPTKRQSPSLKDQDRGFQFSVLYFN